MMPSRRAIICGMAASPLGLDLVPAMASAQMTVFDPAAVAQAIKQVSQGLQQIQALENQVRQAEQMLARLGTDVTGPLREIASQATELMKQAQGLGYQAAQLGQDFQKLYPGDLAGLSPADLARKLAAWSDASRQTLQEAMAVQNQIVQAQPSTASAVAAAVDASQSAVGQTAAVQATNQLLAALSTQFTQLQTLLVTQARQVQTLEAERQGLMAKAAASRQRNSVFRPSPPAFSQESF